MNSPIKLEFFREMGRQGFDAESFCGVMPAEQKIHSKFFGSDGSPMRRFARNECVDLLLGDSVNLRPRATRGESCRRQALPV